MKTFKITSISCCFASLFVAFLVIFGMLPRGISLISAEIKAKPSIIETPVVYGSTSHSGIPVHEKRQLVDLLSLRKSGKLHVSHTTLLHSLKSVNENLKEHKVPRDTEIYSLADRLEALKNEQLKAFSRIRLKLEKSPHTTLARSRLQTIQSTYKQQTEKALTRLHDLHMSIEEYEKNPKIGEEFPFEKWQRAIDEISAALGTRPKRTPIIGQGNSALPVGCIETTQLPVRIQETLPEGYYNPPAAAVEEDMSSLSGKTGLTYLERSIWTAETPLIADRVEQLAGNPVALYEYVLNNIRTDFYYGAQKGAHNTLAQKRGNDYDQAALLIALFRQSNIPARFIRGTIAISLDDAINWTGLQNGAAIDRFFGAAAIPCQPVIENGMIVAFHIEHVWVEVYIPYDDYRGIIMEERGFTWLPLAPSMKPHTWQQGLEVLNAMSFDGAEFLSEYQSTHRPHISPRAFVRQEVESFLRSTSPEIAYEETLYLKNNTPEFMGILPNSTPFKIISINEYYADLPDELTSSVTIKATQHGRTLCQSTIPLPRFNDECIYLAYEPASEDDRAIANSFLGLYHTPPYLVEVRGVLKSGSDIVIPFELPIGMGQEFDLQWSLKTPAGTVTTSDKMFAGNFTAIAIANQTTGYSLPDELEYRADLLYYGQIASYLERLSSSEDEFAGLSRVQTIHAMPSQIVSGGVWDIEYLVDVPFEITWKGLFLDVNLHPLQGISLENNVSHESLFANLIGAESSFLESIVFMEILDIDAISTIQYLGISQDADIPLFTINQTNAAELLPQLTHPTYIIDEITFRISQGYTVTISRDPLSYLDWTGSGFMVTDNDTQKSGWYLSGSIAGGMTAQSPYAINSQIEAALSDPYALHALGDPKHIERIEIYPSANYKTGVVNRMLTEPLKFVVFDRDDQTVEGVSVTFENVGPSKGSTLYKTGVTDNHGTVSAYYSLSSSTGEDPVYAYKDPLSQGNEHPIQVGRHFLRAKIEGTGIVSECYIVFAFPDELDTFICKSGGQVSPCEMPLLSSKIISYMAADAYGNPLANEKLIFSTGGFEWIGVVDEPISQNHSKIVALTVEDIIACGGIIPYDGCGDQTDIIEVTTESPGLAWVYPLLGDVGPAYYTFNIYSEKLGELEPLKYLTCGNDDVLDYLDFLRVVSTRALTDSQGRFIEAYRTGTEVPTAREIFIYHLKEEVGDCFRYYGHYCRIGRGIYTLNTIDTAHITFSLPFASGTVEPEVVEVSPFQTIHTLGDIPAQEVIYVDGTFSYDYEDCSSEGDEITTQKEAEIIQYALPTIWALQGGISNSICIDLDEQHRTIEDTPIYFELLPYDYPALNTFVHIFENESIFYLSGAATGFESTLPQGTYINPANDYQARLVVNEYYENSIPFDSEDEQKSVQLQRIKNFDIVDAEEYNPLLPGKDAILKVDTEPQYIQIHWSIGNFQPDHKAKPILAIIDPNTGVLHAEDDSGSGIITVQATDVEKGCFKQMKVYISCADCNATGNCEKTRGAGNVKLESIDLKFSMGKGARGRLVGDITLKAKYPKPDLATPFQLKFNQMSPEVKAQISQYGLHFVDAPRVFAAVSPIDKYGYNLNFYHKVNGVTEEDPFVTWRIENPEKSDTKYNRLLVTKIVGDVIIENEYEYNDSLKRWKLTTGNRLRIEEITESEIGGDTVYKRIVKDAADIVATKDTTTYHQFPWGEEIISHVVDPEDLALTTTFYFEDDEEKNGYGKIIGQINPDGSWKQYEYDENGRRTKVILPWLDAPFDSPPSVTHVIEYSYAPEDPNDSCSDEHVFRPRKILERVCGKTTSKTFYSHIVTPSYRIEIEERCVDLSASFGDSSNLRTEKYYSLSDSVSAQSGKLKKIIRPDGTMTQYVYSDYGMNGIKREVVHGTVRSPTGIPYKTTREITLYDAFGNIEYEETQVYGDNSFEIIDWIEYSYDEFDHVTDTRKSNGTELSSSWDCCYKTLNTDNAGTNIQFEHDDLGRLKKEDILGSTVIPPWPAQNIISITRAFDAEHRVLSKETRGNNLVLSEETAYDLAGRPTNFKNVHGVSTSFSYDNGGLITTVTHADGGTEKTRRYLDGRVKSITGTAVVPQYYSYGVNGDGTKWSKISTGSKNSPRWEKVTSDTLSRPALYEKPGFMGIESMEHFYNEIGQLIKTTYSDRADTLHEYDELGEQVRSGIDVDGSGQLMLAGSDRITDKEALYVKENNSWWLKSITSTYPHKNSNTPLVLSIEKSRLSGFNNNLVSENISIDRHNNETNEKVFIDRLNKIVKTVVDVPDSIHDNETVTVNGRLQSEKSSTALETTYVHDGLGRIVEINDPRTGKSYIQYNNKGLIEYTENAAGHRFYNMYNQQTGQLIAEKDPKSKFTRYDYNLRNQIVHTWGDVPYPTENVYNEYGQLSEFHMFRGGSGWSNPQWPMGTTGEADRTMFSFHEPTGLLLEKEDSAGQKTQYTYTEGGRIKTRTWARLDASQPLVTTYTYHPKTTDVLQIDYSDDTPDVTFTYNRLGMKESINDAVGFRLLSYTDKLLLKNESITGLYDRTVTWSYEQNPLPGRLAGVSIGNTYSTSYGYENNGRFSTIQWGAGGLNYSATYSYEHNSNLLKSMLLSNGATTLQSSYSWEPKRNLRTQVRHSIGSSTVSQYDYLYDERGLRDSVVYTGQAFNVMGPSHTLYLYNDRYELKETTRYAGAAIGTGSAIHEEYRSYSHDTAGNRTERNEGDFASLYETNALNQYTSIAHDATNETLQYDFDGNLTEIVGEKHLKFTYNAENQLICVEPQNPVVGTKKVLFLYDYVGRRVKKTIETWSSGQWIEELQILYLYDYWNLLEEIKLENGQSPQSTFYVWGLDQSQSLQGAGGAGGLISSYTESDAHYYLMDGNANIGQVLSALDGQIEAHYEYDPFGKITASYGTLADDNPYRFSTKYQDNETGLIYYGYRFYSPDLGRWLSRDPSQELGGLNLYSFLGNNSANYTDYLGLCDINNILLTTTKSAFKNFIYEYTFKTAVLTISKTAFMAAIDGPSPVGDIIGGLMFAYDAVQLVSALKTAFENYDTIKSTIEELANDPYIAEKIRCISEDTCTEIAAAVGDFIGSAISSWASKKTVNALNKNLKQLAVSKFLTTGGKSNVKSKNPNLLAPKREISWTSRTKQELPGPGEDLYVGKYWKSSKANRDTGLNSTHTPHHAMADAESTTSHAKGATINIEKSIHEQTETMRSRRPSNLTKRQHMAADIIELRNLLKAEGKDPSLVNQSLQELIKQNKLSGALEK